MKNKIISALTLAAASLSGPVPAAFAANGRKDNSTLVVSIFLGFCALIVVAQIFPAIREMRRAAAAERERTAQEAAVKIPIEDDPHGSES